MVKIKIFGERNTGTKFLERLIHHNLDTITLPGVVPKFITSTFGRRNEIVRDLYFKLTYHRNLGWKHAMAPSAAGLCNIDISNILFVTITKNPYSWLLSLYRSPYHSKEKVSSFESFLVTPWKTVGRENHVGAFKNPIEMWNVKNSSYQKLACFASSLLIRYEDLLQEPRAFINDLAIDFGIPKRGCVNIDESGIDGESERFAYYKKYYLEEQWMAKLNTDLIDTINSHLDSNLMTSLGYDLLG